MAINRYTYCSGQQSLDFRAIETKEGALFLQLFELGVIFVSIVVENMGVPLPVEASYLLAAKLLRDGFSYILMLILLTTAHLTGSILSFGLGWWGEGWLTDRLQKRSGFMKASKAIHKWYADHGKITIFATRFVGYVRPWSSLVAGFAHIEFGSFVCWTLVGSLLFNIIVMIFTQYLLSWWYQFGTVFKVASAVLLVISFSAVFIVHHFWQKSHKEESDQE
ncbi:MAG: VTT domain-containing protein [Syntrophomonas sp.]